MKKAALHHSFTIFVALLALWTAPAFAHAVVVSSSPAPQESVAGPDLDIELQFNSRVDAARSRLRLAKPDGSVANVPAAADSESDRLEGHVEGLAPGKYRLLWQTLSVDGHITHGEIPFEVSR